MIEQFKNGVDHDIRTYLEDQKPSDLTKAATLANEYSLVHRCTSKHNESFRRTLEYKNNFIITLILRERHYPIIREQYRKSETIVMNSTRKIGKALKTLFHSVVTVNATGITSQTAERDCLINLLPNQYWLITLIKREKNR